MFAFWKFGSETYFRRNSRKNMSTPTAAQIEALLNFLEEHRDLARGNLRSVEGRALSHRLWEEVCTTLNAIAIRRRRIRRQSAPQRHDSVRDRLFRIEECRGEREERNLELAGIRTAVLELCSLMRQLIELLNTKNK